MPSARTLLLLSSLLGIAVCAAKMSGSAQGSDFTAFADDEDVCRRAGAAAIGGGSGPAAAQRYDAAYGRCMVAHGRMRQMGAYAAGPAGPAYPKGNPHSFEYPDAFYSVPYATPGYGYDGFSD